MRRFLGPNRVQTLCVTSQGNLHHAQADLLASSVPQHKASRQAVVLVNGIYHYRSRRRQGRKIEYDRLMTEHLSSGKQRTCSWAAWKHGKPRR